MNSKLKVILITIGMSVISPAQAQKNEENDNDKSNFISRSIAEEKLVFKLNYFGELGLHPGIEIGTDLTLAKRNWITVHWDTGLGAYWHRWNNTSLFMRTSIGARLHLSSLFIDFNAGVGYMHSFLAGDVYGPSPKGGIEQVSDWGTSHFMPSFSILLGWDNRRKNDRQWTFHIGPEVYLQSNFNHIFLPHIAANIGITYKLKNNSYD